MRDDVTCLAARPHLSAWFDDELFGVERQEITRHLETCEDCAARVAELGAVGDLLREHVPQRSEGLDGLAGGVVARLGAEQQASWRGLFARALDGWHWAIVGSGALVATIVNTAVLAVILSFGPRPTNQDSLSVVMTNLSSPAGYVFAFVSPIEQGQATAVWQVANGLPAAPRFVTAMAARSEASVSEAALVRQLADVVAPDGRLVPLAKLGRAERAAAEALLDELTRLRMQDRSVTDTRRTVRLHAVRLVTSVTAKL